MAVGVHLKTSFSYLIFLLQTQQLTSAEDKHMGGERRGALWSSKAIKC